MGLKYNETLFIKIPENIKEVAKQRAEFRGKTLSEYVRDLIVRDIEGKFE